MIDRVLWAIRRPNPVGDHQILVIAWLQYQRTALEPITASLKDIHHVYFDSGIAPQVEYRLRRCDIGEIENTVRDCQRRLRREIGRPVLVDSRNERQYRLLDD